MMDCIEGRDCHEDVHGFIMSDGVMGGRVAGVWLLCGSGEERHLDVEVHSSSTRRESEMLQ